MTSHDPPPPCSIPVISEDAAREALLHEVSGHCCYGKKATNDLVFTNIVPSSAFHVSPCNQHGSDASTPPPPPLAVPVGDVH